MQETAYAKVNLALHVRAREPDGYHRIETVFAFAEDGDVLSAAPAQDLTLAVTGPFAKALAGEADNLVLRAAEALRRRFAVEQGAALVLDKRLPVASGLGGGSADAAAALRLLARLWRLDADEAALTEIATTLGADVPACIRSEPARGEGRGDRLTPLDSAGLAGTPLLLVNPLVPLSTASVFRAWDGVDRGPLATGALHGRNDLEAPASAILPVVRDVLAQLHRLDGVRIARMSGSGASCFALFETDAARDRAKAAIGHTHPHWWRLSTRLR